MPTTKDPGDRFVSLDEVQRWNEEHEPDDQMAPWVCAIGGYEMLREGDAKLAAQWYLMFGHKRHAVIRGGPVVAAQIHRSRGMAHYGTMYWGSPNGWSYHWPEEWNARLAEEMIHRYKIRWFLPQDRAVLEQLHSGGLGDEVG